MGKVVADGVPWAQIKHAPVVMAGAQMFTNMNWHRCPVTGDEEALFLLAVEENLWILRMIGRCTFFSNMENIDRWIEAFQSSDQCASANYSHR